MNPLDYVPTGLILILILSTVIVLLSGMGEDEPIRKIYFSKDTIDLLNIRFATETNEFIYCLYGYELDDGYLIDYAYPPSIIYATPTSVLNSPCIMNENWLGTIHSHPSTKKKACSLSRTDIYSFGRENSRINGIICAIDEFVFIDQDIYVPYEVYEII